MSSVEFYRRYRIGEMGDGAEIMQWAITYEAYLLLMQMYFIPKAVAKWITSVNTWTSSLAPLFTALPLMMHKKKVIKLGCVRIDHFKYGLRM